MATKEKSGADELPSNRRDLTALQRERVRELIGRSDRRIAKKLISEGLFLKPETCVTDDDVKRFEASCRRTVCNHRKAIRDSWKKLKPAELGDQVETQEFIARLLSRMDDLDELLERGDIKPTAKVNALAEIRQLETLIAKAKGVDIDWKRFGKGEGEGDGGAQSELPFIGVLADLDRCSPELRAEIKRERERRSGGAKITAAPDPDVQVQR